MNILFIGCVKSSYILLRELVENKFNIIGVITKKTSHYNSDFYDLGLYCQKVGIDYFYCDNINDPCSLQYIMEKKPDIIYCFGWSQLLKDEVIRLSPKGIIGFHPTPLPYNRGRHPIIWTLALGLDHTASTFFMIENEADSGDIVAQHFIEVYWDDDANSLYERIMSVAKQQVIKLTDDFIHGTVQFIEQDKGKANIWRKRGKNDGKIDFRMGALNIYNLVRALTKPYVGAHFEYNNKEYKVWKCSVIEDRNKRFQNLEPGKIIMVYTETSFLVKTGDDLLKVLECENIILDEGDYL